MSLKERIALCLLLEKVNENEGWCRQKGVIDKSYIKKQVKK